MFRPNKTNILFTILMTLCAPLWIAYFALLGGDFTIRDMGHESYGGNTISEIYLTIIRWTLFMPISLFNRNLFLSTIEPSWIRTIVYGVPFVLYNYFLTCILLGAVKKYKAVKILLFSVPIILIIVFLLHWSLVNQRDAAMKIIRDKRLSKTEHLVTNPLTQSPDIEGWLLYQSKILSLSFPSDWLIKECQPSEDCEYHPPVVILSNNNYILFQQRFSTSSQCDQLHTKYEKNFSQPITVSGSEGYMFEQKSGDSESTGLTTLSTYVKHENSCIEFLGGYNSAENREILLTILHSLKFR